MTKKSELRRAGMCACVALALAASTLTSCSSGSSSSSSARTPASKSTSWAGVGQLVVAQLDSSGKVSGTPYQHTELTASSPGTVKVEVPMSESGLRSLGKGKPPPVSDSTADFTFTPNGTTTQNVRSDLATALPLTVKVSYELDGKSVSPADLEPTRHHLKKQYKSGTLHVTYEIANVSKASTTVSFEGFNGARVQQTITQPLPIVAEVKLTFPKSATDISAPKGVLAAGVSGVGATWSFALAPPLSASTQSISYTVHLGEVKVPKTTVEAEVLTPNASPSGNAPAASAAALASLEAAAEQGLSGPPLSLGGVRSDLERSQASTRSGLDAQKRVQKDANDGAQTSRSSMDGLQSDVTNLAESQSSASEATGQSAGAQLDGLQATANQALGGVADESSATGSLLTAGLTSDMTAITGSISSLASDLASNATGLAGHAVVADALVSAARALVAMVANLSTIVEQHAADASLLDLDLIALIADANSFPSSEKTEPEWVKLAGDLASAKAKADVVSAAAGSVAQLVETVAGAVQALLTKTVALDADAHSLEAGAAGAAGRLHSDVASKEAALQMSLANVSDGVASANALLTAGAAHISTATGEAKASLSTVEQQGSAKVASAAGQAKAGVQHVLSSAQEALDKANDEYAQLLALSQISQAHQLPGGNATGVNVQNGAWVYRIASIG
jgi:putative membrane protein